MHIGVLTTSFPTSASDSAGRFVYEMADALASRGHRITVIAPEPNHTIAKLDWLSTNIDVRWTGYLPRREFQITFHGAGAPENISTNRWALAGALGWLSSSSRALQRNASEWDAVITHWALPSALIATLVAPHLPHLAFVHSGEVHWIERLGGVGAWLGRLATRADVVAFVGQRVRDRFETATGASVPHGLIQPMGIATPPTLDRVRVRAALGLDGPTILTMSRLVEIKQLDLVMDAVAALPSVRLVIAGDGPDRERLENHARRLRLDCRFVGTIGGETKASWLAAADVFAFSSRRLASGREEGAPVSIREAMAAGLPVVATDTGCVAEMIRNGQNGWLVAENDVAAMRGALQRLVDDPSGRIAMGMRARCDATAWDWAAAAERIEHQLASIRLDSCHGARRKSSRGQQGAAENRTDPPPR